MMAIRSGQLDQDGSRSIKAGSFLKFYIPQLVHIEFGFTYQKWRNIGMMVSKNPGIWGSFLHKIVQI